MRLRCARSSRIRGTTVDSVTNVLQHRILATCRPQDSFSAAARGRYKGCRLRPGSRSTHLARQAERLQATPIRVVVPRALGVASHTGFLSGRLTSSNEGTWVLFHHDSSAAPQTVQTASPVCGTKNFVSVRLYSVPQLHRTIVAILGICGRNRPFSSVEVRHNQTDPLPKHKRHALSLPETNPRICIAGGFIVSRAS
jgi:hypothetical protein